MSRWSRRKGMSLARIVELYRAGMIDRDGAEERFRRYARQAIVAEGGDRVDHINMVALLDEVVRNPVEEWPTAIKFWTASILIEAPWVKFVRPTTGAAS